MNLETALMQEIKKLAELPQGVVCKHWVMLQLLQIIEQSGTPLDKSLVKACSDADDSGILRLFSSHDSEV